MSKDYSESGIGAEESALKSYFTSYLGQLEEHYRMNSALPSDSVEDITFDMDDLASERNLVVRPPSPIKSRHHPASAEVQNGDSSLSELEVLVQQIKRADNYCGKLTDILLRSLNKTLGDEIFKMFVDGRLPSNCWPIIRMNDTNTPYVEAIFKSDSSDQSLTTQLCGYSAEHMAYSKFILDHLYASANKARPVGGQELLKPTPKSQLPPIPSKSTIKDLPPRTKQTPATQQHNQETQPKKLKSKVGTDLDELITSAQMMGSSTPISKQKKAQPTKRPTSTLKTQIDPNNSKRYLPHRSCKSKNTSM